MARRYPTETLKNANYTDDLALLTNTPAQVAKSKQQKVNK